MMAEVRLWGRTIGAVSLDEGRDVAARWRESVRVAHQLDVSP